MGSAETRNKAISIKKITHRNRHQALGLCLHPNQTGWVPPVAQTLKCQDVGAAECCGIYAGRVMAGFFAFTKDPRLGHVCFLFGFLIDKAYQQQGVGTLALEAVPGIVSQHHPDCTRIRITVHPWNPVARHFYLAAGFHPTSEWLGEQPVWEKKIT